MPSFQYYDFTIHYWEAGLRISPVCSISEWWLVINLMKNIEFFPEQIGLRDEVREAKHSNP